MQCRGQILLQLSLEHCLGPIEAMHLALVFKEFLIPSSAERREIGSRAAGGAGQAKIKVYQ